MTISNVSPRCLKVLSSGLKVISALVKYKVNGSSYTVTVEDGLSWEESLATVTMLNKSGKEVYKNVNDGNRTAILVNLLWMNDEATIVMHNNSKLFYIPRMDTLVSASSKKVVWKNKSNPQRISMLAEVKSN